MLNDKSLYLGRKKHLKIGKINFFKRKLHITIVVAVVPVISPIVHGKKLRNAQV